MDMIVDNSATLADLRKPGVRLTIRRVRLAGPLADERTERALNRAFFACGCHEGSVAVLGTLILWLCLAIPIGFATPFAWWSLPLYLAGAAFAGKLIGLGFARLQLRRIYRSLEIRADTTAVVSHPV